MKKLCFTMTLACTMLSIYQIVDKKIVTHAQTKEEQFTYTPRNNDDVYEDVLGKFNRLYEDAINEPDRDIQAGKFAKAEISLLESSIAIPFGSEESTYLLTSIIPHLTNKRTGGLYKHKNFYNCDHYFYKSELEELDKLYYDSLKNGTEYDFRKKIDLDFGYHIIDDITYKMDYTFTSFNPYLYGNYHTRLMFNQCFDGLVEMGMNGEVLPSLATSYSVSSDGLVYTFNLDTEAKWIKSDGTVYRQIYAQDFVDGLKYFIDMDNNYDYILHANDYLFNDILDFDKVGIKALSPTKLQITIDKKFPDFIAHLAQNQIYPLCKEFYGYGENFAKFQHPESLLYCGAYYPKFCNPKKAILIPNPHYHNSRNEHLMEEINFEYDDFEIDNIDKSNLSSAKYAEIYFSPSFKYYDYIMNNSSLKICVNYAPLSNITGTILFNVNRKNFRAYNDSVISNKTELKKEETAKVLQNYYFKQAFRHALNRIDFVTAENDDLKLYGARTLFNSYDIYYLTKEIKVNGAVFPKGTLYGDIIKKLYRALDVKEHVNPFNTTRGKYYVNETYAALPDVIEAPIVLETVALKNHQDEINAFKKIIEEAYPGQIEIDVKIVNRQYDYFNAVQEGCYDILFSNYWSADYQRPSAHFLPYIKNSKSLTKFGLADDD